MEHKIITAKKIKEIRKKLGLNQPQAGKIIGGGPSAFRSYESGKMNPSRSTTNLLIMLDNFPQGIELIRNGKTIQQKKQGWLSKLIRKK